MAMISSVSGLTSVGRGEKNRLTPATHRPSIMHPRCQLPLGLRDHLAAQQEDQGTHENDIIMENKLVGLTGQGGRGRVLESH